MDALGITPDDQWLEGRSLLPFLRRQEPIQRDAAFSELDYAFYGARSALGLGVNEARAEMVSTDRWKLVRYEGFEPQLFDLKQDPHELTDLGCEPALVHFRAELLAQLALWRTQRRYRSTMADAQVEHWSRYRKEPGGISIGVW
jgi:arylsulfatase A-like enzyme